MSGPDPVPFDAGASPVAREATLRRLLVGYDGSDASGVASSFGLWLAGKGRARLTLVHVSEDDLTHAAGAESTASLELLAGATEHRLDEDRHWRRELDNVRAYAAETASVETVLVRGHAAKAVLGEADARDIDLILVGSTGIGRVRGRFLGSVSSQVMERARCSVMIFRDGQPASPAHTQAIVVGVDGSPGSQAAVAPATELARSLDAKLVLVYAYDPSVALDLHTSEHGRELRRHGADVLQAAHEGLTGGVVVVEELAEGRAREQLAAASERYRPAIIAVGSRGHGGFKGLLLGSTSRWVANHASCPVVVVRRS